MLSDEYNHILIQIVSCIHQNLERERGNPKLPRMHHEGID
jgi:hypothetical protein